MAFSLRARLLLFFLLPTLLFFAVAGTTSWFLSRSILEEELGRSLSAIAASAATQVRGALLLEIEPGDDVNDGTLTYRNVFRRLKDVQEATSAHRVFAFDTSLKMRADSTHSLPVGTEIASLARDREEVAAVLRGHPTSSRVLFVGRDGRTYKTGYAPIFKDGEVVGGLAVEGSAEFFGPLQRLLQSFWVWGLFSAAVLGGLAFWVSHSVSAPLTRLEKSALRIQQGDLKTRVSPESMREMGNLAQSLEEMREAVFQRDGQLKMMLAGVAHEVRNPMGGIELFAGLLSESLDDDEARSHVAKIQRETAYLKRIVEEFLAFAREEKLVRQAFSAPEWLKATSDMLVNDAREKKVSVVVQASPSQLHADRTLLTSALLNLLKNAIAASSEGGVVEVVGENTERGYRISVADSGHGIPPELQGRLFEPFFTTRAQGTGLGLPLTLKWVKAHGGEVRFSSRPGQTVFWLELPGAAP